MNNSEIATFVKGLTVLSERHENDNVSVFETDWSRLCKEAASYILELERKLEEKGEIIKEWETWYANNESKIVRALNKQDTLDIPIYKDKESVPLSAWDGVRRDIDISEDDYAEDTEPV